MLNHFDLTPLLLKRYSGYPGKVGRYSVSKVYALLQGWTTPEEYLKGEEIEFEAAMRMSNGVHKHEQVQELLELDGWTCELKKEYVYKDITIVGKADAIKDYILEIKTSEKLHKTAKSWHVHQARMYCSMFEYPEAKVVQPVIKNNRLLLNVLRTSKRNDAWFNGELEKIYELHKQIEATFLRQREGTDNEERPHETTED